MSHTQLTSIVPTTDGETWLDAWMGGNNIEEAVSRHHQDYIKISRIIFLPSRDTTITTNQHRSSNRVEQAEDVPLTCFIKSVSDTCVVS